MIRGLLDYHSAGLSPSRWIASLGRSADRAAVWNAASRALPALRPVPQFAGEISLGELLGALVGGGADRHPHGGAGPEETGTLPVFETAGAEGEAAAPGAGRKGWAAEMFRRNIPAPLPDVPPGALSEARLKGLLGQNQAGLDRPAKAKAAGAGLALLKDLLASPRRTVPLPSPHPPAPSPLPQGERGRGVQSAFPQSSLDGRGQGRLDWLSPPSPLVGEGGRGDEGYSDRRKLAPVLQPVDAQGGQALAGRRPQGWEAPASAEILQRLPSLSQMGLSRPVGGPAAPLGLLEGLAHRMDAQPSLRTGLSAGAGARAFHPAWTEGETNSETEMDLETGGEAPHPPRLDMAGVRQARVSGGRMKPGLADGQSRLPKPAYPDVPFRPAQPSGRETARPAPPELEGHAPVQRNVFNVTIHQSGGFEDETELADRLTRILIDQARRHGIDVS